MTIDLATERAMRRHHAGGGAPAPTRPAIPAVCPACGCPDRETEPAYDDEGMPTGALRVLCAECRRELGELAPPEPTAEAEAAERVILPEPVEREEEPPATV